MSHISWVQNLARRLVTDTHQAEDLAQESVLAVLSARGKLRSPRRFLTRVTKNLVFLQLRRRERRERREGTAALSERTESTFEEFERQSTHTLVVEAVQGLPGHYRDVLLLRFFEDQTPTQIAAQLEVPVSTVKTRLARAQAQLRERLDRLCGGDGKSWLAGLAPLLVDRPVVKASAQAAGISAATWLAIGLMFGAVVLFVLGPWRSGTRTRIHVEPIAARTIEPAADRSSLASMAPASAGRRVPEGGVDTSAGPVRGKDLQPWIRLRGRVLDHQNQAVPGVVVRMRPYEGGGPTGERIAMTDADGAFSFERFWPGGTVEVAAEEWINVLVGETGQGDPSSEMIVVVAPQHTVRGRVLDEAGIPVAAASCEVILPADYRTRFEGGLGRSSTVGFATASDEAGEFELTVPVMTGAHLLVTKMGFVGVTNELSDPLGLANIVLGRTPATGTVLRGRVLGASGQPQGHALVTNGTVMRESELDGGFEIAIEGDTEHVIAFLPGEGVAVFRPERTNADKVWPSEIELRLHSPRSVRGQVVDPTAHPPGNGLGGVQLWLVDPTACSVPVASAGKLQRSSSPQAHVASVEQLLAQIGNAQPHAITAPDGTFELGGLLDRDYGIAALDPASLTRTHAHILPRLESKVTLALDPGALHDVVRGRVVDTTGHPVQGADVRFATWLKGELAGPASNLLRSPAVTTGLDGSFLLNSVPKENALIEVSGVKILRQQVPLDDPAELTIVADRAAHLRVQILVPQGNEHFSVLSADGTPLPVHHFHGAETWVDHKAPLASGRSEVVTVSALANRVVVFRGTSLIAEEQVSLLAGELTDLQVRGD